MTTQKHQWSKLEIVKEAIATLKHDYLVMDCHFWVPCNPPFLFPIHFSLLTLLLWLLIVFSVIPRLYKCLRKKIKQVCSNWPTPNDCVTLWHRGRWPLEESDLPRHCQNDHSVLFLYFVPIGLAQKYIHCDIPTHIITFWFPILLPQPPFPPSLGSPTPPPK